MSIPNVGEVWKHTKTGGEYVILELGKLQVKNELLDMKECVVYKSKSDGAVWVRQLEDFIEAINIRGFEESRFTKV